MPHYMFHKYMNSVGERGRQQISGVPRGQNETLLESILVQGRHQTQQRERERNIEQEPSILRNILKFGQQVASNLMMAASTSETNLEGRCCDGVTSTSALMESKARIKKMNKKKPKVITILSSPAGLHQSSRRLRKRKASKEQHNAANNGGGGSGTTRTPGNMKVLLVIRPKTRQCPICQLQFGTYHEMRRHCEKHTKPVQCGVCGKLFHKWEHLRQHEGHHFPYHCSFCPKRFIVKAGLEMHHVEYHGLQPNGQEKEAEEYRFFLFDMTSEPKPPPKPYWLQLCKIGKNTEEQQQPLNLSCKRKTNKF